MATQFNLRCSEEEKVSWGKKAHSEGVVLSAWLRSLANEACGMDCRSGPKAVREPAQPKLLRRAAVVRGERPRLATAINDPPKPKAPFKRSDIKYDPEFQ